MKKINKKELKIGTKIEMEHTLNKDVAKKIALDHLKEYPNYYTKGLIPMERKLKRINTKKKSNCQVNKILNSVPDYKKQAKNYISIRR